MWPRISPRSAAVKRAKFTLLPPTGSSVAGAAGSALSRDQSTVGTELTGRPMTESNLSLPAPAQVAAVLSRHVAGSNRDWNRADRSIRCRCAEGSGLAGGRTHDLSGMQGLRAVDHSWAEPVFRHRAVLAGMGCSLAEEVEIRVQDSSAEVRCLVLP